MDLAQRSAIGTSTELVEQWRERWADHVNERLASLDIDARESDPTRSFAERRGISFRERVAEVVRKIVPERARSIFASFRPSPEQQPAIAPALGRSKASPHDIGRGVERYARALTDIDRMTGQGLTPMPHQEAASDKAFTALNQLQPRAGHDLSIALSRQPELIAEAASGRTANAVRAMQLEAEIRTNPQLRADRFIENWRRLSDARQHAYQFGGGGEYRRITDYMGKMTDDIGRDAQLESLLQKPRP